MTNPYRTPAPRPTARPLPQAQEAVCPLWGRCIS